MSVLVIGAGQIGQAIYEILKPFHEVYMRDLEDISFDGVKTLHICYPDSVNFVSHTRDYIEEYKPELTLIHSSISPGKTRLCGQHVVHCPARGRHPKLTLEIPAFSIFVGAANMDDATKACTYLEGCGLVTKPVNDPNATELCKLLSNVHMGLEIAWRQEVGRILKMRGVPASVYEAWEDSYNLGYRVTGNEQLTRPLMRPDPIGGHCILECLRILSAQHPSPLLDWIKESNGKAKREAGRPVAATV